jgi:hypothetical protein
VLQWRIAGAIRVYSLGAMEPIRCRTWSSWGCSISLMGKISQRSLRIPENP